MPKIIEFSSEWYAFFAFFGFIVFFLGLSEAARKFFKWSPETTRKLVHVLVGITLSFGPFVLIGGLPLAALGILFTVVNYLTLRSDSLKGMHTTDRVSYGTVYFPVAYTILVLIYWERSQAILLTSMLVLTFADTAATIAGERFGRGRTFILWKDRKSLPGSAAFFAAAFFVVLLLLPFFNSLDRYGADLPFSAFALTAFFAAALGTAAEAASNRGSDNLSLTLVTAFAIDLCLARFGNGTSVVLLEGFLVSAVMAVVSFKLRALDAGGAVGAFILGSLLFGAGGWTAMVPLFLFFALSSILSKAVAKNKVDKTISRKGSRRDIVQVYSNGGVALVLILAWFLSGYSASWLYFAFLASLAAATADTWETETGSFSPSDPRHIIEFRKVPRGTSGGITLVGSLGGLAGAFLIAFSGLLFFRGQPADCLLSPVRMMILVTAAGFLGSVVDSLLGGTIQAVFKCDSCGKDTEKLVHCGLPTRHAGGIIWLDNDLVNLACTASGALILILFL